jgi:4-amino-4-deoxy-L-arabinose transferase-like glycosyltransferase
MGLRLRERTDIALVAVISLATNFAYFFYAAADYFFPDSFTYLTPARNLLHGLGFINSDGVIETLRTPGYPLFLAAFGLHVAPVIVFQHLLNVALAVAIYLLVIRRLGSRLIALTAAILFAIDTPTLHYANKILTETFFTAILFAVFVLVVYARKLPLAGVLTGLLVLIRPVAIVYFIVVMLCLALRRVRMRTIAVYAALALALPLSWQLRNLHHTGVFTISSIGGINLMAYRAAGVLAIEDDGDFDSDLTSEMQGLQTDADTEIEARLHIPDAEELPDAVRSKYYSQFALRVLRQHPRAAVMLTLRGLLVNFFDSRWDAMEVVSRFPMTIVQHGLDAYTACCFVFAVIGAAALWRRDRDLAMLTIATIIYFLLISAGGEAEARFRVPVIPQYMIAAACGVEAVKRGLGVARPISETRSST